VIDQKSHINIVTGSNFSGKSCRLHQVRVLIYLVHYFRTRSYAYKFFTSNILRMKSFRKLEIQLLLYLHHLKRDPELTLWANNYSSLILWDQTSWLCSNIISKCWEKFLVIATPWPRISKCISSIGALLTLPHKLLMVLRWLLNMFLRFHCIVSVFRSVTSTVWARQMTRSMLILGSLLMCYATRHFAVCIHSAARKMFNKLSSKSIQAQITNRFHTSSGSWTAEISMLPLSGMQERSNVTLWSSIY
jgi:hypothetical protein